MAEFAVCHLVGAVPCSYGDQALGPVTRVGTGPGSSFSEFGELVTEGNQAGFSYVRNRSPPASLDESELLNSF